MVTFVETLEVMGLLNNMINIIGKGVAKGVSEVVEKAVSEAVKPAATKFAEKQADLINAVTKNVETATESVNEAASQVDQEQVRMAMEFLRKNAQTAAEEISKLEVENSLTDDEVLAKWDEKLSDFPKWNCGGNHYDIYRLNEECISFSLDATYSSWIAYQAVLLAAGFRTKYRSETAFWYKEVDGRYPAVHLFHTDDDACQMVLYFYYETKEEIEEAKKL